VLSARGLPLETKDNGGLTPLMYAAWNGHEKMVSALIENGANVNGTNLKGIAPLTYSVWGKHKRIAEILVEGGAIIYAEDDFGKTAASYAKELQCSDILELLSKS
jgi:ankyrin repeat protein